MNCGALDMGSRLAWKKVCRVKPDKSESEAVLGRDYSCWHLAVAAATWWRRVELYERPPLSSRLRERDESNRSPTEAFFGAMRPEGGWNCFLEAFDA